MAGGDKRKEAPGGAAGPDGRKKKKVRAPILVSSQLDTDMLQDWQRRKVEDGTS